MITPLEPSYLKALVQDCPLDDRDELDRRFNKRMQDAKYLLAEKNMAEGVARIVEAFPNFGARLRIDKESPCSRGSGFERWQIYFETPTFRDLHITPGSDGFIHITASRVPIKSFQILGDRQHWQEMVTFLWEHGDQRVISHSIPQLDPQKLSQLTLDEEAHDAYVRSDRKSCPQNSESFVAKNKMAEGLCKLLEEFLLFGPLLCRDKASNVPEDEGHESWRITFTKSPFRGLHLQPTKDERNVEVFAFGKSAKLFRDCDVSAKQRVMLQWLWKYGNQRHFARLSQEVSQSRLKARDKCLRDLQRDGKPLLRRMQRTPGYKVHRGPKPKAKGLKTIVENADIIMGNADELEVSECQPLALADQNRTRGKNRFPLGRKNGQAPLLAKMGKLDIEDLSTVNSVA